MKKLLIIILLSLCCAHSSTAQRLTDNDITFAADPMDLSARTYARLDKHSEKCALV